MTVLHGGVAWMVKRGEQRYLGPLVVEFNEVYDQEVGQRFKKYYKFMYEPKCAGIVLAKTKETTTVLIWSI